MPRGAIEEAVKAVEKGEWTASGSEGFLFPYKRRVRGCKRLSDELSVRTPTSSPRGIRKMLQVDFERHEKDPASAATIGTRRCHLASSRPWCALPSHSSPRPPKSQR